MTPQFTVGQLLDFVIDNKDKGNKCFQGFNREQIAKMLIDATDEHTLFYSHNNEGKITGMIIAAKDSEKKVLYVQNNLAMCLSNLKTFAKKAKEMFTGYKLEWTKHGKLKQHNTELVYKKLI
jgi:hypothetical protein